MLDNATGAIIAFQDEHGHYCGRIVGWGAGRGVQPGLTIQEVVGRIKAAYAKIDPAEAIEEWVRRSTSAPSPWTTVYAPSLCDLLLLIRSNESHYTKIYNETHYVVIVTREGKVVYTERKHAENKATYEEVPSK